MPRPIIGISKNSEIQPHNILSAIYNHEEQNVQKIDKMELDRILRRTRSSQYMDAMHKLDVGGHVHNQDKVNYIIDIIKKEFPEVQIAGILLGCVSICYLGKPYEVHTIEITGGIIEHYKAGQALPGGLEKARNIAMRGGYEFIEVYVDCCRAISSNGAVSVIAC